MRRALGPPGIVDGYEHRCRKVRLIEHADIRALGGCARPPAAFCYGWSRGRQEEGERTEPTLIRTLDVEARDGARASTEVG